MQLRVRRTTVGLLALLLLVPFVTPSQADDPPTKKPADGDPRRKQAYAADMRKAQQVFESDNLTPLPQLLDAYRPRSGEADLRGWEWHQLHMLAQAQRLRQQGLRLSADGDGQQLRSLAWTGDGKRLFAVKGDGNLRLLDAHTGKDLPAPRVANPRTMPYHYLFSADGSTVVAAQKGRLTGFDLNTAAEAFVVTEKYEAGDSYQGGQFRTKNLALSPDGQRLAFASDKNTIRLYERGTRKSLVLHGHRDWVLSLAWSPDGKQVASGSADGTVRVWDAGTGQAVFVQGGRAADVKEVAWSPDGKCLAAVSGRVNNSQSGNRIGVWDVTTRQPVFDLADQPANNLEWSLDGQRLLFAGQNSKVLDSSSGRALYLPQDTFRDGPEALSPNGRHLAVAGRIRNSQGSFDENLLRILELPSGRELQRFTAYKPVSLVWSPNGNELAMATSLGGIQVLDVTATAVAGRNWQLQDVASFTWSPDSGRYALLVRDRNRGLRNRLHFGSVAPGKEPTPPSDDVLGEVYHLAWSSDGKRLASAHQGSTTIYLWDAVTGQLGLRLTGHGTEGWHNITALVWGPKGKRLATAATDGTVKVWDTASGQEVFHLATGGHQSNEMHLLAWGKDEQFLAIKTNTPNTSGMRVRIYDLDTGKLAHPVISDPERIPAMALSPDGRLLALAGKEGVKVVALESGEVTATVAASDLSLLSWSPDGSRLLVGPRVWHAASKTLVRLHTSSIPYSNASLAWSPDGQQLATLVSMQGVVVKVYDTAKGTELRTLYRDTVKVPQGTGPPVDWPVGYDGDKPALVWAPDGLKLALAGQVTRSLQAVDPTTRKVLFTVSSAGNQPGNDSAHLSEYDMMLWRPDGKQLAAARRYDSSLTLLDPEGKKNDLIKWVQGRLDLTHPGAWAWSANGQQLAAVTREGVHLWDVAGKGKENRTLTVLQEQGVGSLAWSPDNRKLAILVLISGRGAVVRVFEVGTGKESLLRNLQVTDQQRQGGLAWSPDSKRLAVCVKNLVVWDVATGKEVLNRTGADNAALLWTADGKRLVARGAEIKVWDAASGEEVVILGKKAAETLALLSPDGRWLATKPAGDGKMQIIEVPQDAKR